MQRLRNTYFALRHGRSLANEAGIIISDPASGVPGYGLSEDGSRDARARLAPASLAAQGLTPAATVVLSSDFRRARETAEVLCEEGSLAPPALDPRLRERGFGSLEGGSNTAYERVWEADLLAADAAILGCEPVAAVRARLLALVLEVDAAHEGKRVVLVSHGDPLQILATAFLGLPANGHRSLPHLDTAELRRLGDALLI